MIIIFPPCLWRDISFYEKFSAIKLIAIAIVIIIVIYQWISYRIFMEHEDTGYDHKVNIYIKTIICVNIYCVYIYTDNTTSK